MERLATSSPPAVGVIPPFPLSGDVFRLAFEESSAGISVVSTTGAYLHANRAFCDFVGYSLDELRSLSMGDLLHRDDAARWTRALRWKRRTIWRSAASGCGSTPA